MKTNDDLQHLLESKHREEFSVIPNKIARLSIYSFVFSAIGIGILIGSQTWMLGYTSLAASLLIFISILIGAYRNNVEAKILDTNAIDPTEREQGENQ